MSGRRRGQGEGSIFRLPDGRWRGQVYLGYRDGHRQSKVTTRRTRREAAEWLHRTREEYRTGVIATRAVTLQEWSETYLREVARTRVKPSTYRNYERDFARHINPTLGRVRLDRLEPPDVAQLYKRKLADGLSPASVRLIHATLRRALTVAMRWGLIGRNVALMVDPPRQSHHPVEPLSLDEARALLAAAKGDRMEARWVLALSLGLRQGEVLGLWWQDVDLISGVLRIRRQLIRRQHPGDRLRFADLKTARSRRVLALPAPLVGLLHEHRDRQEQEKHLPPAICAGWDDPQVVFTTPIGTAIDHRNDARNFKKLLARAGVRDVRLHDLRHTAASLLLAQDVHPRVVMELLGHSQIGLTMNTYSHVMPTLLRDAADSIEGTLWGDSQ